MGGVNVLLYFDFPFRDAVVVLASMFAYQQTLSELNCVALYLCCQLLCFMQSGASRGLFFLNTSSYLGVYCDFWIDFYIPVKQTSYFLRPFCNVNETSLGEEPFLYSEMMMNRVFFANEC